MAKTDWLLEEEAAARLRTEASEVRALADAGAFAFLQLPSGERRIDARSFRRYVRACQLGYELRYERPFPLPKPSGV